MINSIPLLFVSILSCVLNKIFLEIYFLTLVVIQSYESEADNEYVIRGNSVVMKCEIPSYVADFVFVDLWMDSEGQNYYPNSEEIG